MQQLGRLYLRGGLAAGLPSLVVFVLTSQQSLPLLWHFGGVLGVGAAVLILVGAWGNTP